MTVVELEFEVKAPHLHLAVKNGASQCVVQIWLQGHIAREFSIELALDGKADWWAFYDITEFLGEQVCLKLEGDDLHAAMPQLQERVIRQGEGLLQAADLYQEAHRPQFHFTSRRGWNNDPNGMVYERGTWHLYYQYNPFGITWGNMHWGHATSRDMIHWEEQPVALYQKSLWDMAFSGGAVIDRGNTAGFKKASTDPQASPLVISFTSTGRGECLAYSLDGGKTHVEYEANPVIQHAGRDPKIIWYEPGLKWVMVVYEEIEDKKGYALYDSRDLKHWNRLQFIPGYFECPELFELPVDGNPGHKKWVLHGSTWEQYPSAYVVGNFDGNHFTPEMEPQKGHFGPHFYAAQIFNLAPEDRKIMIGWLRGAAFPGMPFSQGMTVPLELALGSTPQGFRLCFSPVPEIRGLYQLTQGIQGISIAQANEFFAGASAELMDIRLQLIPDSSKSFILHLYGQQIQYNPAAGCLICLGQEASVLLYNGLLDLRILVDRSVMEVFAGKGEAAFAGMALFDRSSAGIFLEGEGKIGKLTIHALKSMWG